MMGMFSPGVMAELSWLSCEEEYLKAMLTTEGWCLALLTASQTELAPLSSQLTADLLLVASLPVAGLPMAQQR